MVDLAQPPGGSLRLRIRIRIGARTPSTRLGTGQCTENGSMRFCLFIFSFPFDIVFCLALNGGSGFSENKRFPSSWLIDDALA